jgi:hypothetical protein
METILKIVNYQAQQLTDLFISTYSISPEKEKNSFRSCSDAPKETLLTFIVLICKENTSNIKS